MDEKAAQSLLDLHTPKAKKSSETETKIFDGGDDKGEEVPHTVILEEKTTEMEEDQAGPNPGSRHEGLAGSNLDLHQEDQARPNPSSRCVDQTRPDFKPIHKKFLTSAYSRVRINLKIVAEEQARLENPTTSSETISSLKNLEDPFTYGDQFLLDKENEEELEKTAQETKAKSIFSVPIHQASPSAPPLSTLVIDLSSPKPSSTMAEKPTTTITTTTTATTLPLLPPLPQHQRLTDPDLTTYISDLEQQLADLVRTNATLAEQVDKHHSRLNTLELRGLPHKISITVREEVKRSVQDAMQAPLREQFRELPEADMKHILEHRIWESRSYETHQDHMNLYEALQKSIEHPPPPPPKDSDKSKKRRHDSGASRSTLPPSLPLADSDRSKKKKHSSGASGSSKPYATQSSAWTTSNTKDTLSGSSKQRKASSEYQPINDDPVPTNEEHSSNDEDTSAAHIPKVDTRKDWWKPIPEEERPETLEPA
ncbi:hypothetical protein Tco_1076214 [Tanacetum coccineum]